MRYLSLFSGIGGFELGIKQAYEILDNKEVWGQGETEDLSVRPRGDIGSESDVRQYSTCIGFSEIDKYATQIYQKHFPNHKNYGDITKIKAEELPDFDLLVGGFPCQAFSIAGKRGGFNDTRGTLFFEIARIAREKQPRLLLLENVKGLLSHNKGSTFYTIISTLDELGYDIQWQVLNSKNHGVPQNRERVFIIGHLRGTSRPEVFPFGETDREDVQENGEEQKGGSWVSTLDSRYGQRWSSETYVQSNDTQIRRLTPTECERLQGFPDGWTEGVSDTQRYKTLGNTVTVNVIKDIMQCML